MLSGSGPGITLFKFRGVDVILDFSVLLMIGLFFIPQAFIFQRIYDGWSTAEVWGAVFLISFLFLLSILIHELSHAWTGMVLGANVLSVRLLFFGGATYFDRLPSSEGRRFWISAVGPLSNFALWIIFHFAAQSSRDADIARIIASGVGEISVLTVAFSTLSLVNLFLAIFNALPGYPMDGGQALKSAIIFFTKKDLLAARIVMVTGVIVGGGIVLWGVQALTGWTPDGFGRPDAIAALFRGLIGYWIISGSIGQFRDAERFQPIMPGKPQADQKAVPFTGVPVGQVMNVPPVSFVAHTPVSEFLNYTAQIGLDDRAWLPILGDGYLMGAVNRKLAKRVAEGEQTATTLEKIMLARRQLLVVKMEDDMGVGRQAVRASSDQPVGVLGPGGQFAGFLLRENL
jgi:Zn-dependent protease